MDATRADRLAVLFALVLPMLVTLVYFVWAEGLPAGVQQGTYAVGKVVQFTFPLAWVVLIQRRRPRLARPTLAGLAQGIGFGLLVLAAMLALYHGYLEPSGLLDSAASAMRAKVLGMGIDTVAQYAALGVFYSLLHSLLEEYYWRWFVFAQLRRFAPLALAVLVSSLGFMAHHVVVLAGYFGWTSPATWLFSLSVAIGGAVWACLYERHQTLWGVWASHLLVDAGIFIVGYDLVGPALGG
jgi:membrane protease YdiL (CAAX protease family)